MNEHASDDLDRGFDPSRDIDVPIGQITGVAELPDSYMIPSNMLPPVGRQGTEAEPGVPPSCAAWASTYDLATAAAARSGGYDPRTSDLQASPAFIYIQVTAASSPPCKGSALQDYFRLLAQSGTPTLSNAQYVANCAKLISLYHDSENPPASNLKFKRAFPSVVAATDSQSIKQALLQNRPLAYGTGLYTDWGVYRGTPEPYVGNGIRAKNKKTGKPAGHCMMIIGYTDDMLYNNGQKRGAYRIQNSEGTDWGDNGYLWMAYDTFTALAQGKCFVY